MGWRSEPQGTGSPGTPSSTPTGLAPAALTAAAPAALHGFSSTASPSAAAAPLRSHPEAPHSPLGLEAPAPAAAPKLKAMRGPQRREACPQPLPPRTNRRRFRSQPHSPSGCCGTPGPVRAVMRRQAARRYYCGPGGGGRLPSRPLLLGAFR